MSYFLPLLFQSSEFLTKIVLRLSSAQFHHCILHEKANCCTTGLKQSIPANLACPSI